MGGCCSVHSVGKPLSSQGASSLAPQRPVGSRSPSSVSFRGSAAPHVPDGSTAATRRLGREVSERWVAHHTARSSEHAEQEVAHLESIREVTASRLQEEAAAHEAAEAEVQAEAARALSSHLARVSEDAAVVHPREAREWPTEHTHVRALAALPAAAPGEGGEGGATSRLVATASDDSMVRVFALSASEDGWVAGQCRQVLHSHSGAVLCLAALGPGSLASGGRDGVVSVWDLQGEGSCQRQLTGHRGAVLALTALGDGRLASGGEDGTVRTWDPAQASSECQLTLWGHGPAPGGGGRDDVCALTPLTLRVPGRYSSAPATLLCLASGGMDGQVLVWDVSPLARQPGAIRARLQGHTTTITALVQLADGRLVSAAQDGSVRLWQWGEEEAAAAGVAAAEPALPSCTLLLGHPSMVMCLALHPDGQRLLSGSTDGSVHVWDVGHPEVWSVALEPQVHGHKDGIWCMLSLADGSVLSGGFGATVRVWDVEESHIKWRPEGSERPSGSPRAGAAAARAAAAAAAAIAAAAAAAAQAAVRLDEGSPAPSQASTRLSPGTPQVSTRLSSGSLQVNPLLSAMDTSSQSLRFITRS